MTFVALVVLKLPELLKDTLYILLLLLPLGFSSCVDEIDTRDGNEKSTLVVESYLVPNQTVNSAFLSTSIVINTRNQEFTFPEDATITLEELSTGEQTIMTYSSALESYADNDMIIKEGETYELSASVPDENFDIIFAQTTIPKSVEILEVDLLEEPTVVDRLDGTQSLRYDFLISFDEPVVSPTYFHLFPSADVLTIDEENDTSSVYKGLEPFEDFNFSLGGGNSSHDLEHLGGILINHSKLENNQMLVSFYTNAGFDIENYFIEDVNFELRTVEESYYNFLLSTSKQIRAQESTSGQPVASFTNVSNGLGVVSSYNPSIKEISVR